MMAGLLDGSGATDLQSLIAQFQPSAEDQAAARKQAQLQFFLGLLGAPKGGEFQRIGESGLLASKGYQDQIKQAQAMRGQNITQAAQLMGILRQQRTMDMANQIFADDNSAPPGPSMPAPGLPQGAVGGGGMGGGTPAAFGPSSQPGPVASAAPATQMQLPTWKQLMPKAAQAMALASGDPKTILEQISKYTETKMGPDGTVTTVTGVPLYKMTSSGVQFFTPQGMPGEFSPFPQGSTDAEAKRTATIAGATTAAQKAAEFPYQLDTATGPNGAQTRGYAANLYGPPPIPSAPQPSQPQAPQMPMDALSRLSPQQLAYMSQQAPNERAAYLQAVLGAQGGQQSTVTAPAGGGAPFAGLPQRPGTITSPDPLVMERAKGAIASQTAQNTLIGEGQGKDFLGIIDAEKQAPGNIAKYDLMKQYLSKIDTGKLAPSVLGLKSVAAYVAPNLAKEWTKDVPYAQAVSALSNEIALQLRNPQGGAGMPGSMSDSDRNFLVSMAAGVANDPRAIPLMLDARIALEKRSQEIGKIARAYRQQNGTIDEGFYQQIQDFANSHPMFNGMTVPGSAAPAGWSIKKIN